MGEDTPRVGSYFIFSLLDAANQPNLVTNSFQSHQLTWRLNNNQQEPLVVKPFESGKVDQNQYHFQFKFTPGALTAQPTLQGWDVFSVKDEGGGIEYLYIALSEGTTLTIEPNDHHDSTLTYTSAIQEDAGSPQVGVQLTTGQEVYNGTTKIPGKSYGPFNLTLVPDDTPALSAPPLTVDFVGRRTVLNDGHSPNSFTFALTNMTQADIPLTPDVVFTVWFDAAPNQTADVYPCALARVQNLDSDDFKLTVVPAGWTYTKLSTTSKDDPTVGPRWQINVTQALALKPQEPVFFTFGVISTDLNPGIARMYLSFLNLPGSPPGTLIAELEKTPLLYGATRGQGLYLSAGLPQGNTPPAPNYDNGLYVEQFGKGAAAVFAGGNVGIGTVAGPPVAKLHIVDLPSNSDGGTLILGSDKPGDPSLRFGYEPGYSWVQAHGSKPLAINPTPRNVGIGLPNPGSLLSVNGGVAVGKNFALENTTIAADCLGVEGNVGIGTTVPHARLEIVLKEDDSMTNPLRIAKGTHEYLSVLNNSHVGVGTGSPQARLEIAVDDKDTTTDLLRVGKGATSYLTISNSGGFGIGTTDTKQSMLCVVAQTKNNAGNTAYFAAPQIGSHISWIHYGAYGDWYIRSASEKGRVIIQDNKGDTVVVGNMSLQGTLNLNGDTPQVTLGANADSAWVVDQNGGALRFYRQASAKNNDTLQMVLGVNNVSIVGEIQNYSPARKAWYRLAAGEQPGGYQWATMVPLSDGRLKEEVRPIPGALEKVRRLRGILHRWSAAGLDYLTRPSVNAVSAGPDATEEELQTLRRAEREKVAAKLSGTQVGLLAQDVEAVVPEAVFENEDGHKCVRYQQLVALLVEAIKEQDEAISEHARRIARQQAALDRLTEV